MELFGDVDGRLFEAREIDIVLPLALLVSYLISSGVTA